MAWRDQTAHAVAMLRPRRSLGAPLALLAIFVLSTCSSSRTVPSDQELVETLDWEVLNGGFEQYFFNTRGEFVVETADALQRMGLSEQAGVFEIAAARFESERSLYESAWSEFDSSPSVSVFAELDAQSSLSDFDEQWVPIFDQ